MNKKSFLIKFLVTIFTGFSLLYVHSLSAQNGKLDSLLTVIKTQKQDSSYVKNLIKISRLYYAQSDFNNVKTYVQKSINISEAINYKKGLPNAYALFGAVYSALNSYDSALYMFNNGIKNCNPLKDQLFVSRIYLNISGIYSKKGDFNYALNYCLKSLNVVEKISDTLGLINCYDAIAQVYSSQRNTKNALAYLFKALKLAEKVSDNEAIRLYGNIGVAYFNNKNMDQALNYFLKSLALSENVKIKDNLSTIISLNNVSTIYLYQKKYELALKYSQKALLICEETQDSRAFCTVYVTLGEIYLHLNKLKEAEGYLIKGLKLANAIGLKLSSNTANRFLSELYEKKSDYKLALVYEKLYSDIKDTIFNTESNKQITEMNTKYETEKKDKELIKKDKEIAIKEAQTEKEAIIKNGFIIAFIFLLGLIGFVYRGYVQKQKTNLLLNDKNKKITDSINYAKLIQNSILPPPDDLNKYLPQSFIFYQPKDIVSGDFYWFYPINDDTLVLAVADCTGHGVPGAFMTMIGHSILSEIVIERKITLPNEILSNLHSKIFKKLQQNKGDAYSQDGMDISLVVIDRKESVVHFAGARNNAYLINNTEVKTLKATQKSIGGLSILGELEPERSFKSETVPYSPNSLLVLSTDGIFDQLNFQDEKFGTKRFIEMMKSAQTTETSQSIGIIEKVYSQWRGKNQQQDDVLVFGVKI